MSGSLTFRALISATAAYGPEPKRAGARRRSSVWSSSVSRRGESIRPCGGVRHGYRPLGLVPAAWSEGVHHNITDPEESGRGPSDMDAGMADFSEDQG